METILLYGDEKKTKLIIQLSKEMGIQAKKITMSQLEDIKLAKEIEEGLKTKTVSKAKVLKALKALKS